MDKRRIVIKVGTSSLTYENGKLNLCSMERLVRVVADLKNSGKEIVLVSSAAIAVGQNRLGLKSRPKETKEKQATAAVGQCDLMAMYSKLFHEYGWNVAQMLLTRDCIDDRKRRENAMNTMECLLEMGAVPIINENDTVSVEELVFGDNDKLSAMVAAVCGADMLIILTDTEGLFDRDPRENSDAKLISRVDKITDEIYFGRSRHESRHRRNENQDRSRRICFKSRHRYHRYVGKPAVGNLQNIRRGKGRYAF